MAYKDAASYTNGSDDTVDSSTLSGNVPAAGPVEPFVSQVYVKDALIYDPSYIFKYKQPTMSEMIGAINRLAAAVTDLQSVVVNLVEECNETRNVLDSDVWRFTRKCCDDLGIDYSSVGLLWDGSGVLQEGISAYINATDIK